MSTSLEDRLQAILKQEGNLVCAECPEVAPTWACLFSSSAANNSKFGEANEPDTAVGGSQLGIFCCYKCYGKLGFENNLARVKSTRSARQCKLVFEKKVPQGQFFVDLPGTTISLYYLSLC